MMSCIPDSPIRIVIHKHKKFNHATVLQWIKNLWLQVFNDQNKEFKGAVGNKSLLLQKDSPWQKKSISKQPDRFLNTCLILPPPATIISQAFGDPFRFP